MNDQVAPIWATATPLSFALRLQKPRLLRQAAPSARLLLSTRFGRDTGPDDATHAAKAGLRKPGATSLRLATHPERCSHVVLVSSYSTSPCSAPGTRSSYGSPEMNALAKVSPTAAMVARGAALGWQ